MDTGIRGYLLIYNMEYRREHPAAEVWTRRFRPENRFVE